MLYYWDFPLFPTSYIVPLIWAQANPYVDNFDDFYPCQSYNFRKERETLHHRGRFTTNTELILRWEFPELILRLKIASELLVSEASIFVDVNNFSDFNLLKFYT